MFSLRVENIVCLMEKFFLLSKFISYGTYTMSSIVVIIVDNGMRFIGWC